MIARASIASVSLLMGLCMAAPVMAQECSEFPPYNATPQQKTAARACAERKSDARLGKYFCFIKNMAGIQYPPKGKSIDEDAVPFVGRIRPASDKFFLEITKNDLRYCQSDAGKSDDLACDDWGRSPYSISSKSADISLEGRGNDTFVFKTLFGRFNLYMDYSYKSFTTLGNSYIAEGKCEKIN